MNRCYADICPAYIRKTEILEHIAELMDISAATIYSEFKRTLSYEEYTSGRFIKYSVERAINREIELATKRIKGK